MRKLGRACAGKPCLRRGLCEWRELFVCTAHGYFEIVRKILPHFFVKSKALKKLFSFLSAAFVIDRRGGGLRCPHEKLSSLIVLASHVFLDKSSLKGLTILLAAECGTKMPPYKILLAVCLHK